MNITLPYAKILHFHGYVNVLQHFHFSALPFTAVGLHTPLKRWFFKSRTGKCQIAQWLFFFYILLNMPTSPDKIICSLHFIWVKVYFKFLEKDVIQWNQICPMPHHRNSQQYIACAYLEKEEHIRLRRTVHIASINWFIWHRYIFKGKQWAGLAWFCLFQWQYINVQVWKRIYPSTLHYLTLKLNNLFHASCQ